MNGPNSSNFEGFHDLCTNQMTRELHLTKKKKPAIKSAKASQRQFHNYRYSHIYFSLFFFLFSAFSLDLSFLALKAVLQCFYPSPWSIFSYCLTIHHLLVVSRKGIFTIIRILKGLIGSLKLHLPSQDEMDVFYLCAPTK